MSKLVQVIRQDLLKRILFRSEATCFPDKLLDQGQDLLETTKPAVAPEENLTRHVLPQLVKQLLVVVTSVYRADDSPLSPLLETHSL
jgi:hypothetical protein